MQHHDAQSLAGKAQRATKALAEHGWRALWRLTRINVGPSQDELSLLALEHRIRRPARERDGYQIGVIGLKGGVGRTTVTAALGSIFSTIRGDRVLAIDIDPSGGNLADRTARRTPATIEQLLRDANVQRYHDIRDHTQMTDAGLEVLAAPEYSSSRAVLSADDWHAVTGIVAPYYNVIVADAGKGLHNPATRAALSTMSGAVIVCSASTDTPDRESSSMGRDAEYMPENAPAHGFRPNGSSMTAAVGSLWRSKA